MEPILFIIPGACSFGSQVALEWSNSPYKVGITTPQIRAGEEFRKINPTGKVGALKDGDNVIGENLAILLHLVDKHPESSMCPKAGSYARSKVYQWLSYLASTLHPTFAQTLFPSVFVSETNMEDFKQRALGRLHTVFELIDKSLARGFLVEDHPLIIDAQAYGILRWARGFHGQPPVVDLKPFSNISSFLTQMENNPAVKNALLIEKGQGDKLTDSKFSGYFEFN